MNIQELRQRQRWSLDQKIDHTFGTIDEFCRKVDNPVISFSGGKDSTVLMHLVRNIMKRDLPAIFVNTGNEYPEIVKFATKKYNNVTVLRPKTNITRIIEKYGFPLISKEYSKMIYELRNGSKYAQRYLTGKQADGKETSFILPQKYRFLVNERFNCSDKCCSFLKKQPTSKLNSITAEMAVESVLREKSWIKTGCNSFGKHNKSKPFSIWTERDILEYKQQFNVEFCEIYEDARVARTGCMFCGFGATFEGLSRFEIPMERYPKIYKYFLNIKNNDVTYQEALNICGVILPHQKGYQKNIFSKYENELEIFI